jgi:hypothetical protein
LANLIVCPRDFGACVWRIEKFQNCVYIKVNYTTDKKTTPEDFSDNIRNIKFFVQVDHLEKFIKNLFIFLFTAPGKSPVAGKFSKRAQSNTYRYQNTMLKFQENPTTTRFRIWALTQTPKSLGQTIKSDLFL